MKIVPQQQHLDKSEKLLVFTGYICKRLLQCVVFSKSHKILPCIQLNPVFSVTDFKGNLVHIFFLKRMTGATVCSCNLTGPFPNDQ